MFSLTLLGWCTWLAAPSHAAPLTAETLVRAGALSLAAAERRLRTLVGLLEPILILSFALIVGLVATALLQAVYSLRPGGP